MTDSLHFDLEAGTTELYADPVYYDYEFRRRRADVQWYIERYVEVEGPILELGVGSGRVALPAVREGVEVVGLDQSAEMLERAEARRRRLPKVHRDALELVHGDMRAFALDRRFALVSCPFNAFMHLYTRDDVERCLACVRAHLEPGDLFALDVLTPDFGYLSRSPFRRHPGVRFKHPTWHTYYTYAERSAYDPIRQINQMWFHYDRADETEEGPESYTVQLSHRYFFPEELDALLHYNGFETLVRFGDFDGSELQPDSESMVILATPR